MEILNGTQRAVQPVQMSSPIDPQRHNPQHLHGLPTPGKDSFHHLPLPYYELSVSLQPPLPNYVLNPITNMCRR